MSKRPALHEFDEELTVSSKRRRVNNIAGEQTNVGC